MLITEHLFISSYLKFQFFWTRSIIGIVVLGKARADCLFKFEFVDIHVRRTYVQMKLKIISKSRK